MEPNPEKLSCISIIICDEVYRDEVTKKLVIVGTFNRIATQGLPCQHPAMTVLFTLTNGRGKYDLSLSIEHEKTGATIAELRGPVEVTDPLMMSDVSVKLGNVTFPEAGKYWVTLKADEEIIQQRPFAIKLLESNTSGGGQHE